MGARTAFVYTLKSHDLWLLCDGRVCIHWCLVGLWLSHTSNFILIHFNLLFVIFISFFLFLSFYFFHQICIQFVPFLFIQHNKHQTIHVQCIQNYIQHIPSFHVYLIEAQSRDCALPYIQFILFMSFGSMACILWCVVFVMYCTCMIVCVCLWSMWISFIVSKYMWMSMHECTHMFESVQTNLPVVPTAHYTEMSAL